MADIYKRDNIFLNREQKEELSHSLKTIDSKGTGYISLSSLGDALNAVGVKIPPYEVRKMAAEMERKKLATVKGAHNHYPPTANHVNGASGDDDSAAARITFFEFEKLYRDLKSKDFATTFKSMVSRRDNLVTHGGMSETSSEGTTHTIRQEEQVAFSHWINTNLGHDKDLKYLLPIDQEGTQLYDRVKDGILLCKIINFSCPDTIDERALNKKNLNLYTMHENLVLAINSALAIGCNVVNIGADDLSKGKPHLVLGLLWQIIRIGLFNQVDLHHCPGLIKLLQEGEKLEDMMKLSTEAILLRWVNYHLKNAGYDRTITNFSTDIMDSMAYIHLIHEIAPKDKGVSLSAIREPELERRAELMLREADRIKCRAFVSPRDVVSGNPKLNVAFVANMFNTHPALLLADVAKVVEEIRQDEGLVEETREEKTYRNWMNSMGVSPYVNWLYSDLTDGLVILQLYDYIQPGIVDWPKVHRRFSKLKAFMEKIENCNYAIHLGKRIRFSLVGIAGQDINDGNPTLTLALVWQLMRAYTLSLLCNLTSSDKDAQSVKPIAEKDIIVWVNNKLKANGKTSKISSFQDSGISDARVVIDLIDCIKTGCIDYTQVKEGISDEDKLANAKYAISMSRKLGAKIYALPDDIIEVKPKMVMTVFACLMSRDYNLIHNINSCLISSPPSTVCTNGPSSEIKESSPSNSESSSNSSIQKPIIDGGNKISNFNGKISPSPATKYVRSPTKQAVASNLVAAPTGENYRKNLTPTPTNSNVSSSTQHSPVKSPLTKNGSFKPAPNQNVIFSSSSSSNNCNSQATRYNNSTHCNNNHYNKVSSITNGNNNAAAINDVSGSKSPVNGGTTSPSNFTGILKKGPPSLSPDKFYPPQQSTPSPVLSQKLGGAPVAHRESGGDGLFSPTNSHVSQRSNKSDLDCVREKILGSTSKNSPIPPISTDTVIDHKPAVAAVLDCNSEGDDDDEHIAYLKYADHMCNGVEPDVDSRNSPLAPVHITHPYHGAISQQELLLNGMSMENNINSPPPPLEPPSDYNDEEDVDDVELEQLKAYENYRPASQVETSIANSNASSPRKIKTGALPNGTLSPGVIDDRDSIGNRHLGPISSPLKSPAGARQLNQQASTDTSPCQPVEDIDRLSAWINNRNYAEDDGSDGEELIEDGTDNTENFETEQAELLKALTFAKQNALSPTPIVQYTTTPNGTVKHNSPSHKTANGIANGHV